jgi:predicted tellurium resistance membrane protein TerC
MSQLFTLDNLFTLFMLTLLQAVLGFDNLLYVSLESKRAPADRQAAVRRWGIGLAVALRIVLLFVVINLIEAVDNTLFALHWGDFVHGEFTLHAVIVLFGGAFILNTATKEILHMMAVEDLHSAPTRQRSVGNIIFWIVLMNLVFSFDSILSAIALTDVFAVMATAILIGGALMIFLADKVASFLEKNRMYEVLGLFILFVVGIMLVTEGGHLAHLTLFGSAVMPMTKTTFYFVIGVLAVTDIVQSRYQKKLNARRARNQAKAPVTPS